VSPTGAQGIAQFEPGTAAGHGVSPFDPASAIPGAARLLASYHSRFGSWSLAAAAYNAGVGAVESAGGVPQNGQTPSYVADVMAMSGLGETT
jgi:soluble lytic murein transglycosylase-like protein